MIIIPIGHEKMFVERLPFVTIGIILFCVGIYFPSSMAINTQLEDQRQALEAVYTYHQQHDYLTLPEKLASNMPKGYDIIKQSRQEWMSWYSDSPSEVEAWLYERKNNQGLDSNTMLASTLLDLNSSLNQSKEIQQVAIDTATSETAKLVFLRKITSLSGNEIAAQQTELVQICNKYEMVASKPSFQRFAYIPAQPSIKGIICHQFLHASVFHLIFNMLFLWLAGAKLEDIWTRPIFLGLFLLFGIVGALTHGAINSSSTVPLVGASGAVAGLMGAFFIRYARAEIRFFYFFIFGLSVRKGFFSAPAYIMLPLWFVGELFWALLWNIGTVAYWAHVGGFLCGIAVALVFRKTKFEQKVLGREPDEDRKQDEMPLVVIPNNPAPLVPSIKPLSPLASHSDKQSQPPIPHFEPIELGAPHELTPADPMPRHLFQPTPSRAPTSATASETVKEPLSVLPAAATLAATAVANGQSPVNKHSSAPPIVPGKIIRTNISELLHTRLSSNGVSGRLTNGETVELEQGDIAFILAARIDQIDHPSADEIFSTGLIENPALIVFLVRPKAIGPHHDLLTGYAIDGNKLGYNTLMRNTFPSRTKNFVALTKILLRLFPHAQYIPGPGPVAGHNLPIYTDFDQIWSQLRKAAARVR